jgi:hypothetical protein
MLSSYVTTFKLIFRGSRRLSDFLLGWEYELLLRTFEQPIERSVWGMVWAMALTSYLLVEDLVLLRVVG